MDVRDSPTGLADAGLSGGESKGHTIGGRSATVVVGAIWWWAVRRRRRRTTYVAGVLPFGVVLFFSYANVELLLPGGLLKAGPWPTLSLVLHCVVKRTCPGRER